MADILNFKGDYEGLSQQKAEEKLAMYGENSFSDYEDKSFRASHILLSPAVILLFISGLLELLALHNLVGGITLITLAIAGAVLLAVYCSKCNESIARQISDAKMKYRVVREGKLSLVPQAQLVPDDIIVLQSGEMVPADAHILELYELTVDESRFTDSKTPVDKFAGADPKSDGLKATCIYAGSRILTGNVIARVFATGPDAYRSCRGRTEKRPDPNYSLYEKAYVKFRLPIMLVGAGIAVGSVFISAAMGKDAYTMSQAVRALGFMLCFTPPFAELLIRLYYIDCVKKCEEKGAVKNLTVLQDLSGITSLVIDKSAVAAPGRMEVAGIYSSSNSLMTTVTVLASNIKNTTLTEQAFMLSAQLAGTDIKALRDNELIKSYEYDNDERMGGNIYRIDDKMLLCVKGAVEKVLSLCDIPAENLTSVVNRAASLAGKGYEIWASAYVILDEDDPLPQSLYNVQYSFMGLVSYIGATRDMIPLAVQSCKKAGVKLVMTTSDSRETAAAIGRKIGLSPDNMISGDDIRCAAINDEAPDYKKAEIFCSVTDEQKLTIVDNLKAGGEKVAVFGNDSSEYDLLRLSDLGITSLAKTTGCVYEASGLIIREDNFAAVVDIIKEARQLHRNIKKAVSLCLSAFIITLLVAVVDIIFSTGAITPALCGLLSLFVVPVCAMCYMGCSADLKTDMKSSGFAGFGTISRGFVTEAFLNGGIIGFVCALFSYIVAGLLPPMQAASATLVLIVASIASLALSAISKSIPLSLVFKHNAVKTKSVVAVILTAALTVLFTFIPFVNTSLNFDIANPIALIAAVVIGIIPAVVKEIIKKI